MGNCASKFKVLFREAQSGKTTLMTMLMLVRICADYFRGDEEQPYLNIIISANNRALVCQTSCRVENASVSDGVFSWMSGGKNNISSEDLAFRIITGMVDVVVCCANATRIKYIAKVIEHITKVRDFKRKIKIWVDEGDQSIKLWEKYEHILELDSVVQFSPMTATIDSIHKKYAGQYSVFHFPKAHEECYRGLDSCVVVAEDTLAGTSTVEYTENVVDKHIAELAKPGVCLFAPGDFRRASHEAITETLTSKGFVVALFNGTRKEIVFPGGRRIDLRPYFKVSDEMVELSRTLATMYTQEGLYRYPFAITGYYCIQRGITFQSRAEEGKHRGFLFTHSIVPPIADKAEAYQVMARVFGNIGEFPDYKGGATIFSVEAMFRKVKDQETLARNLSVHIDEGKLVDDDDIAFSRGEKVTVVECQFFPCSKETFDAAVGPELHRKFPDWKFENPFDNSERHGMDPNGKWMGSFRGWRVLDYSTVLQEKKAKLGEKISRRITICYKGDILGVAIQNVTDRKQIDTHNPFM